MYDVVEKEQLYLIFFIIIGLTLSIGISSKPNKSIFEDIQQISYDIILIDAIILLVYGIFYSCIISKYTKELYNYNHQLVNIYNQEN